MNFQAFLDSLVVSDRASLGPLDVLIATCLPFLLSFVITAVYRSTQKTQNWSVAFIHSIFLFSCLISVVTMVVGNNVANAFGLMGSLSIIRFRNALKSPLDAMYIFWALVVGMACGTGYYFAAIGVTLMCGVFALFLDLIKYGERTQQDSILKVFTQGNEGSDTLAAVEKMLGGYVRSFKRLNVLFNSELQMKTYVYTMRTRKKVDLPKLQSEITAIPGVVRIHHLNSEATAFVQ